MSLQIVYGRAGTGKSEYCFNQISEQIKKQDSKIFVITPEQFSFTAEKKLLEESGSNAIIKAEVLTFNRMAYRLMQEVGGATKVNLSDVGKSMLIYDILYKNKDNLTFLGKSEENIDLISTQITEFKKHKVSTEDLDEVMKETDDKYLKEKLNDMRTIYSEFEKNIKDRFIDENDMLTILAENLDKTNMFDNTIIYIDEFIGFTKQEYIIISKLLKKAKKVIITLCMDSINIQRAPEVDVFYTCKQTKDTLLIDIAEKQGIEVEEPIKLEKTYRFKTNELSFLEKNIYEIPYNKYNENVENVELFLAKNQYTEIENVAIKIVDLVKKKNYRYKDIAIITKNIETYSNLCKVIFEKYKIPLFIDEKKDLSQNILVQYILAILEIFAKNWKSDAVFNYLKMGFSGLDGKEIYEVEKYCLKWGITRNKWYRKEWKFDSDSEKYEAIRKKIVNPLLEFENKIKAERNTETITKCLYEYLIQNEIDKKLQIEIEKLETVPKYQEIANDYKKSWNILMKIFDEIVMVFGKEKMSFDKYMKLLKIGLTKSELGSIPGTQDQVIVGDVDRTRSHKIKAIFIIGLNDGQFPSVNRNEGFFNDNDRENLKENGIEMAKGTLENLYEENFNIYKAFTIAEEKIFLSYVSSDTSGKSFRPSVMVSKIKKLYPKLEEKSDLVNRTSEVVNEKTTFEELLNNLRDYRDGKEIDEKWFNIYEYYNQNPEWKTKLYKSLEGLRYNNLAENISKENIENLYGDTLKTSITKLETYSRCPFSYYLKYGLKLQEEKEYEIETLDTGILIHNIIDDFFQSTEKKVKEMSDEEIEKIVSEIIDENLSFTQNYKFKSSEKFIVLTNKLKRTVIKSIKYIVKGLKKSKFEIAGNEIAFKEGEKYGTIKLELEDGRKVEIEGKIDRLDIAKDEEEKKYFRIIDYKSSEKNINLNEVLAGTQLQLLTYMDAICENEKDLIPSGVLYFAVKESKISKGREISEEKVNAEIEKKFEMKGLIVKNEKIAQMMDCEMDSKGSKIVPIRFDKGQLKDSDSLIEREKLDILLNKIKEIIKEISTNILEGNIEIKPYYNVSANKKQCEYCKYKSICRFNPKDKNNKYNYVRKQSNKEIMENL